MWRFDIYSECKKAEWDSCVRTGRNSSFLFLRDYMDYHSDRFRDSSMLAYKDNRLLAVLPANITEDRVLHSHQGLTYGGWVLPVRHLDTPDFMEMWHEWKEYCKSLGISAIDYKPLPSIYCTMPSEEAEYALWKDDAVMTGCGISSTIDNLNNPGYNSLQRRHLRKAEESGFTVLETNEAAHFMDVLSSCLAERHGAVPVHSAPELRMLMNRFPDNIRIFTVGREDEILGGVCMYLNRMVAHCQYIATTEEGRRKNLLSLLFHHLIGKEFKDYRFFDFGISTEDSGHILNTGLSRQKYSLGGSATLYRRYLLNLI